MIMVVEDMGNIFINTPVYPNLINNLHDENLCLRLRSCTISQKKFNVGRSASPHSVTYLVSKFTQSWNIWDRNKTVLRKYSQREDDSQ